MKQAFGLMLALPLAFCATSGNGPSNVPVSDYCQIANPVRVSQKDTRLTKEQADRELRKWKSVCGQR